MEKRYYSKTEDFMKTEKEEIELLAHSDLKFVRIFYE